MNEQFYYKEIKNFDKIPKEVLGAVLVSVLSNAGELLYNCKDEDKINIDLEIQKEWEFLFSYNYVSQKPKKLIQRKSNEIRINQIIKKESLFI